MYNVVKSVIETKAYDLADIIKKIDTLWVQGAFTDEQKEELQTLARNCASAGNSVDVMQKLEEFDKRITALEKALQTDIPTDDEEQTEENIAEFVVGKWYYNGDKVKFDGKTYKCTAPNGDPCVWSPKDYPAYWEEV